MLCDWHGAEGCNGVMPQGRGCNGVMPQGCNGVMPQGRFAKGRKLGTGATNVVHVVTLDGSEYAGRSIIALAEPAFREMYGMTTTAAIQALQHPGGLLAALEEEIEVVAMALRALLPHSRPLQVHRNLPAHDRISALKGVVDGTVHDVTFPHYCLMELGQGGTLASLLWPDGPAPRGTLKALPAEQVHTFSRELLEGLAHLHSHDVQHRDLKPANVLVDEQRQHIKICDFGEAKNAGAATATGTMRGTPCYTAPEVGVGRYNRKVDVYSVAVMIMEMLGLPPAVTHETRSHSRMCRGK